MSLIGLLGSFLLLVLCARPAWSQVAASVGEIRGVSVDSSGAAVPNPNVTAANTSTGLTRSVTGGPDGAFVVPQLPVGTYKVTVSAAGFSEQTAENIEIRVGESVFLNIPLQVAGVATTVEVTGTAPVIEITRYQQSTTIEREKIENLPINRRSFLDFALLAPGVSDTSSTVEGTDLRVAQVPESGLSFGGGNGRGNGFFLDGVENFANSGGVRTSVSQSAVQEFQINRNSFSAEYGWISGGAINIVTRSGTNEIHGSLFGFLRHSSIQARNYFDPGKASYTRLQSGGTFGAPLRKDKTFLFAAFERLDRNESAFVTILHDRSAFNRYTDSQKELFDFMRGSGQFLLQAVAAQADELLIPGKYPEVVSLFERNNGRFPFSEHTMVPSIRIDHYLSDRHNLFFRANLTTLKQGSAQTGGLVAYNRSRSFDAVDSTVMLADTYILSPQWLVDTRLMFNYNRQYVLPVDPYGPEINVEGYGNFGRDIFLPSRTYERHYQVLQNWSYITGRHTVKFGFDINPVRDSVNSETFFSGRFGFGQAIPLDLLFATATGDPQFPTNVANLLRTFGRPDLVDNLSAPITALQAYALGVPTFYQQGFGNPYWMGWSKRQGFYGQYSFQVRQGLTLNAGMRYDLEINPKVLGTDGNNIAPRIGFAWSPGSSGKTVIRGAYGIYYMPTYAQFANVADTLSGRYIDQVLVTARGVPQIINPMTGKPVTSIDIYTTLRDQGVIGTRPLTSADILQFGITPRGDLPGRVVFGSDPVINAYVQQTSFEIERGFGGWAVSLSYNFNRGAHIGRTVGRNLVYSGQLPDGRPTYNFIDPDILQKNYYSYDANSFYHAGIVQVNRRFSRGFSVSANYTWSKSIDESTDFNSDFAPHDQLNPRAERALSSFHQAHRVVANLVYQSPWQARNGNLLHQVFGDWNIAPIMVYSSWRPFNILTGFDNLNDGYINTHRPHGAGRNIGRGPDFFSTDLRLSRRIPLEDSGRVSLEVIAEGFNLLNRTNFRTVNNIVGDIQLEDLPKKIEGIKASPNVPLAFTSAGDPRQFQFALRINY